MNTIHSTHSGTKDTASAFHRLGALVARRRKAFLIGYLIFMGITGVFGVRVFDALGSGGFSDPGSDSSRAAASLAEEFRAQEPFVVIAVETPSGPEADAASASAILERVAAIDGVSAIVSYWSTGGAPQFLGTDGTTGLALVFGGDGADVEASSRSIVDAVSGRQGALTVHVFGADVIGNAFEEQITQDLGAAEAVSLPVTALLLIFVFGSVVAAGLPFLVAGGTILGAFLILFLITLTTDVSIFALNLVTGLGLALGIDYALLMINRFREELRAAPSTAEAVARTVDSAGRTVLFSGMAVATALASMFIFPQYFLRSFAYAGIAVSVLAVVGALTAIPALMAILGANVNRLKVRRGDLVPKEDGAWSRIARVVMRRAWPVFLATSVLLLVMASTGFGAVFGQVDERSLPADAPVVRASEILRERFPETGGSTLDVVVRDPASTSEVQNYAIRISRVDGIDQVITPTEVIVDGAVVAPNPDPTTWTIDGAIRLQAVSSVRPVDPAGQALVEAVRAVPVTAAEVLVGGRAAVWADATSGVLDRIWIIALWLAITTLVILFLFTGSVLIPVKAIVLNLLSLSATLGALVWTFQGGHLTWLTGEYTATGTIDVSTLALIAVIAFALSMDYEVFMLARIKEEHDAGRSTTDAVALGLQRTGRIVTAAALLIAIVFASFLTSGATNIKQLGFGVTVAILLDATVVRALLVPALMRLAGDANWWAPAPLRRLYGRVGLREG